jgi:uncharacterized membrane protein
MTNSTNEALSHPLVVAYLADLDRALASADAQERLDTLASVTEHLTDALAGDAEPTTAHVQSVLDELGSVEQIANAATPASASPAEEPRRGQWVAPALLGAAIVSLLSPFVGALLAVGCLVAAIVLLRGDTPRRGMLRATIGVSIATLVVNALMAMGLLAFTTFSSTSVTESGVTVSEEPAIVTDSNE